MVEEDRALVLRWMLDLELHGRLESLTAVVVTKSGRVKFVSIGNPTPITIERELKCANSL